MVRNKKKTGRKRPKSDQPPLMSDIIDRLHDGIAHIRVAYQVVVNGSGGAESVVLLSGIQMLEECESRLEHYDHYYNPTADK